jgi:PAS domain S-box-containing protein
VETVLGYTPAELLGERFIRFVHPEDRDAIRREFEEVLRGRIRPSEYRMRSREGGYRWVRTSSRPVREGAQVVGLHGVLSDVTERKRAEEALRESETRYRSVFENAGTATVIIEDDMTISMANPEFEKLSGFSRTEVEGKMRFVEFAAPEERERLEDFHRRRRREGQEPPREYEYEFLDRAGKGKHVYNKIRVIPGTRRSVASLTDLTLRRRMENDLRESEEKYRQLVQHAPAGIYEFDLETMRFLKVNDVMCTYTGYSEEEFLSLDPFELICEESHHTLVDLVAEVAAGNRRTEPVEYRVRGKNGRLFWVLARASFFFEEGVPKRATAVVHDITDRKQAEAEKQRLEAQLRQSQKMEAIGTLAGGIAHDFNNILSAIIGYTEMARLDLPEGGASGTSLKEVLKAAERAKELVKQILAFSRRTEHESMPLHAEPVVKEALQMLRSSLPSSIEIRHAGNPDLPAIMGDPTRIHQVLMNLCTNAAQAIREEQGVIEIRLEETRLDRLGAAKIGDLPPGRYVRLTVRDTGSGIPPEIQERIFDPYFTTKEAGEGTGLGLAVVYGVVSDYGGGVSVESEVGQGTRFSLFFPVVGGAASSYPKARRLPLPQGRGEHLLFVDDEPAIAELGRRYFERLGYRVTARQSSTDALALFRENPHRYDLVITDMTMPRMTGDKLAAAMLSIRPDLPVVLCTGYSHRISEARAREIGIRAFVMKPTTENELAKAVRRALDEQT